jgi:hypothetical protein
MGTVPIGFDAGGCQDTRSNQSRRGATGVRSLKVDAVYPGSNLPTMSWQTSPRFGDSSVVQLMEVFMDSRELDRFLKSLPPSVSTSIEAIDRDYDGSSENFMNIVCGGMCGNVNLP